MDNGSITDNGSNMDFSLSITGSILVVEDDQFILNKIFSEFQIAHLVKYFTNPVKAMEYLLKQVEQPFLILSDINMPVMNFIDFPHRTNTRRSTEQQSESQEWIIAGVD